MSRCAKGVVTTPQQLSDHGWRRCRLVRGQLALEAGIILKQPSRYELDKIESELRVLIVKLSHLVIVDLQDLTILGAFERLRAQLVRQ